MDFVGQVLLFLQDSKLVVSIVNQTEEFSADFGSGEAFPTSNFNESYIPISKRPTWKFFFWIATDFMK